MSEVDQYQTVHQIVKAARQRLDKFLWDYLIGGTETETTLKRNRIAIDSRALRSKVLNDVSQIDTSGSLLGQSLDIPVLLAPIGRLQEFEEGGGASVAIAAKEAGVMSIASSVCEPSLEEIAAASDAPKIYQLYVNFDADAVDKIVQRVIDNNYVGFCLTVDTAVVSRRERDIAKRVMMTSKRNTSAISYRAALNWSDIARIRDKFDIPLIIKGINRVDDAVKAVQHGVDVVYVSNHGGRQLDQGPGALDLLPGIVAEIKGKAEIVIDGGFYRGTDIVKAIAMGADAVGLGRLEAWAMAAGGAPAVVQCLNILRAEIIEVLSLCGVSSFSELDESFVTEAQPVVPPDVFSAFPLLSLEDEGY